MKWTWLPRSSGLTPLAAADTVVTVEVGGPLLELREVLD